MEIDNITLFTTIMASIVGAIFVGLFRIIVKVLNRIKDVNDWIEDELSKGKNELGAERFKIITSSEFIPTQGQTDDSEESGKIIISPDRFLLADKLLKDILSRNMGGWKKRYAILGGTGMGKSTFSAHFLYEYLHHDRFRKCKHPIYIKYLGKKNILNDLCEISKTSDVSNAIIILDAMDENEEATRDIKTFLSKIEDCTDNFRVVIITCRTQFFPNKEAEPSKGVIKQNSATKKFLNWERIYISPFNKDETEKFLENKYRIPSEEYSKAIQIANMCNDLTMRPIILHFVDSLLDIADDKGFTIAEIYYKIIDTWLDNECEGYNISKSNLFIFSKQLAMFMYEKWGKTLDYFISEDEYKKFLSLYDFPNMNFFKERSLLNRTSEGEIKFSHRSFWEFFLAVYSLEHPGRMFCCVGFETAAIFAKELYELSIIKKIKMDSICVFQSNFLVLEDNFEEIEKIYDNFSSQGVENEEFCRLASHYWKCLMQRLAFQYRILPHTNVKVYRNGSVEQKGIDSQIVGFINEILCKIQYALGGLVDSHDSYLEFRISSGILQNIIKSVSLVDITGDIYIPWRNILYPIQGEELIFPFVGSSLKESMERIVMRSNYLYIGAGFSDVNYIYEFVKHILHRQFGFEVICIYRDGDDLESHVKFISALASIVNNDVPNIILLINYKSTPIYYLLNKSSASADPRKIETCLTNMKKINSIASVS